MEVNCICHALQETYFTLKYCLQLKFRQFFIKKTYYGTNTKISDFFIHENTETDSFFEKYKIITVLFSHSFDYLFKNPDSLKNPLFFATYSENPQ